MLVYQSAIDQFYDVDPALFSLLSIIDQYTRFWTLVSRGAGAVGTQTKDRN